MKTNIILNGDALTHLKELPNESINMVMTSPPYWALRDYGVEQQLGLEPTFKQYINRLCNIFDEVKRVLKDDGTIWVNLGDTYAGGGSGQKDTGKHNYPPEVMNANKKTKWNNKVILGDIKLRKRFCCECGNEFKAKSHQYFCSSKCSGVDNTPKSKKGVLENKNLVLIPFHFAIEMQNRGWILRNVIIWNKPNCMPSSVKDRFTVDFEYLFFFSKKKKYYFEEQREEKKDTWGGRWGKMPKGNRPNAMIGRKEMSKEEFAAAYKDRNKRTTWTIPTKSFSEAHFAVYPEELCETPIKAGCPEGGIVLDMFFGSGTTGLVALKQDKKFIGIELNPDYIKIAKERLLPYLEQTKLI